MAQSGPGRYHPEMMKPRALRILLTVVAAVLVPACSRGLKFNSGLLLEGFNGGFPGVAWIAPVVTGSATATVDSGTGFPAPSLRMTTTAATATVRTETISAFNNPNLTISVHMETLTGGTSELGSGRITILDATPAAVAFASWNNAMDQITFHINGGAADQTIAVTPNTMFHRIVFNVNSSGVASWSFDNGAPLVSQGAFPPGLLKLELAATFGAGTAWPSFLFDNITVTSP